MFSFDPADPTLAAKLDVTDRDWRTVLDLTSEEKDVIIMKVGKAASNLIEIQFKKPDDRSNDRGGPICWYEKQNGVWRKRSDLDGAWVVAYTK